MQRVWAAPEIRPDTRPRCSRSALTCCLLCPSRGGSRFCSEFSGAQPLAADAFLMWSDIDLVSVWPLQTCSVSAPSQLWVCCQQGRLSARAGLNHSALSCRTTAGLRPLLDASDSILLSTMLCTDFLPPDLLASASLSATSRNLSALQSRTFWLSGAKYVFF